MSNILDELFGEGFSEPLLDAQYKYNGLLNMRCPPQTIAIKKPLVPKWLFRIALNRHWKIFYRSYPR